MFEEVVDVDLGIEQAQAEEGSLVLLGLPEIVFTDKLPVDEAVASVGCGKGMEYYYLPVVFGQIYGISPEVFGGSAQLHGFELSGQKPGQEKQKAGELQSYRLVQRLTPLTGGWDLRGYDDSRPIASTHFAAEGPRLIISEEPFSWCR